MDCICCSNIKSWRRVSTLELQLLCSTCQQGEQNNGSSSHWGLILLLMLSQWSLNCTSGAGSSITTCLRLQWMTKILGTVMENLPSTSLTYQMFRCSIMYTSLTTWIPRLALPFPLQTMLGWRNTFRTGVKCTGVHKLQHCLGERLKGGKLRQIVLIVLRILSSIVVAWLGFVCHTSMIQFLGESASKCFGFTLWHKEFDDFSLFVLALIGSFHDFTV